MTNVVSAEEARGRFAAAAQEQLSGELVEGVTMELVEEAAWMPANVELWGLASRQAAPLDLATLASDEERRAGEGLDAVLAGALEHRVILRAGGEVVGVYWGQQQSWGRYYMVSSVVHPRWQRRGIYRALLARVMAATAASGFREVYSRHVADNNAVIVPKLRAGFVIAGFEVTPRWGLLVHLRWYPHEGLRQAFSYRLDGRHAAALRERGCKVP